MKLSLNVNSIKSFILNILFPQKCMGCNVRNEILCNDCIYTIQPTERKTDENISAVFDYGDPLIKKAIWKLKYHHRRYLGRKLGQLLYESLIEDISDIKINASSKSIYVVPVPISHKRTKMRGYNQAEIIARGFCNCSPDKSLEIKNNLVVKKVDTIPQAKITNRKKRLQNVLGIFEIKNKNIIKGRTIIIIDDVTTTGGTIKELIKILKIGRASCRERV